jgi:protein-tyrosine phosphatase
LAGAPNFRDIGGYATVDGHHVRWHRVYRSSELSHLTADDAQKVDSLDLASVVDLRTANERDASPSAWLHPPGDIYQSPKATLAPVMHLILDDAGSADGARMGMIKFYAQMPDMYRSEYAAMFHRVAAGDLPILVHCTAGKDRTGVAIAVLMTSIGVSRTAVVEDYELTEQLAIAPAYATKRVAVTASDAKSQDALAHMPEESRRALGRAAPEYIEAALDSIDREYGSSDAYLEHGLGLSKTEIAAVRAALVE